MPVDSPSQHPTSRRSRYGQSDGAHIEPSLDQDRPTKRHQQLSPSQLDESQTITTTTTTTTATTTRTSSPRANSPTESSDQATSATDGKDRNLRQFSIESLLTQEEQEEAVEALDVSPVPSPSTATFSAVHHDSTRHDINSRAKRRHRNREYTLTLVSLPIQCTTGESGTCDPPLVARLDVQGEEGVTVDGEDDLPYLTARATLWEQTTSNVTDKTGQQQRQQQQQQQWQESRQMAGQLMVTPRVYHENKGGSNIYFGFPKLQILRPGSYRISVTLHGHWDEGLSSTNTSTEVVRAMAETSTLAVPETSPLAVGRVQVSSRTAELLDMLNRQGAGLL